MRTRHPELLKIKNNSLPANFISVFDQNPANESENLRKLIPIIGAWGGTYGWTGGTYGYFPSLLCPQGLVMVAVAFFSQTCAGNV